MKVFSKTKLGVMQGSVLSPLLCNIYLHKLDTFMYKLKEEFSSPPSVRRKSYPEFNVLKKAISKNPPEMKELIKKRRNIPSKDPFDPNFRKLFYVRYADDFLIGITGSRKETIEVLEKIRNFLSSELSMNLKDSKTHIVHFKKKSVFFLGTTIYGISRKEKPMRTVKHPSWKTSIKVRVTPRVGLHAPIEHLLLKLKANKFVKQDASGTFKPTALRRLINLDHADIIGYYNSISRGIMNYYSFADNYTRIGAIVKYHLLHSCALTLALKYKLRMKAKAFKRFGSTLNDPDTGRGFHIPKSFRRTQKFSIKPLSAETYIAAKWNNKLTKSGLFKACVICNATPAEMHHIRRVKSLRDKYSQKKLDFFHMQMAAINRKQIPLCKDHHTKLHQGKLSEAEIGAFREGIEKYSKS